MAWRAGINRFLDCLDLVRGVVTALLWNGRKNLIVGESLAQGFEGGGDSGTTGGDLGGFNYANR